MASQYLWTNQCVHQWSLIFELWFQITWLFLKKQVFILKSPWPLAIVKEWPWTLISFSFINSLIYTKHYGTISHQNTSTKLQISKSMTVKLSLQIWTNICVHVISPDFGGSSRFGAFPPGLTLGRRNLPTRGFSYVIFLRLYFCPNILSFTAVSTWRVNCLQLESIWPLLI